MAKVDLNQELDKEFAIKLEELQKALDVIEDASSSLLGYELLNQKRLRFTASFKAEVLSAEIKRRQENDSK